tara:strand:+ start:4488 stop:5642 length:1155 start_codon:yes stop_codon:yes gene_type:complete
MKKLLVIHNKYQIIGGEDIAVENEVNVLKKHYEVEVLYFNNKITNFFMELKSFLLRKNSRSIKVIRDKINNFNPDVVYVHNSWFKVSLGVFDLMSETGIPTIVKLHNFRYFCTQHFLSSAHLSGENLCLACGYTQKKFQFLNKYFQESFIKSFFVILYGKKYIKILKNSDLKILVLTDFHKKFIESLGNFKSKIYVHPNPLNLEIHTSEQNEENYFIYAGRISKEKGVKELIEVFIDADFKEVNLKIVGDGPLLQTLKNKYRNQENIHFEGILKNVEVMELISKSRAVVTATRLYEGQPTLLCEASSIGIPSIFPETGGIREFFPTDYKYSYKQFDYSDLKEKLKILEDRGLSRQTGNENKDYIINLLNEEKFIDNFNMILNDQ